jgi:Flp pilus assembly protein TadD
MTAVTGSNLQIAESHSARALDRLAFGSPAEAAEEFRAAIAASQFGDDTFTEAYHGLIRALRDAGQLNQSIAAAVDLTALTPNDPLAHTALSISLQAAGHVPQAEAAAARARILEWKMQLQIPPAEDSAT